MSDRTAPAAPPQARANRNAEARSGELWAKCPECRVPVKDAELFKHLLNCPGAEVRRAEWAAEQAAQQAAIAINSAAVEPDVQQPDVQQPDVQQPDVQQPDVQQPDVQQPDVQQPDVQP